MSQLRRREFVGVLGSAALWPLAASAQQRGRIPRIGVLWHAGSADEEGSNFVELVQGFRDLGYVEGSTIVFEHRFPNEEPARFRSMAAELVQSGVNVLVGVGANAAPYAKSATATTPVVFIAVPDPVGSGLVTSISRPEANVTGISNSAVDLIGKRVEVLKEMMPELRRIALLVNTNAQVAPVYVEETRAAAIRQELSARTYSWRSPAELEPAFNAMKEANIQALMIAPDGLAFTHRALIADASIRQRFALSGWSRPILEAGALMWYGAEPDAIFRRAAVYVDKLLKGSKPNEIPVEGPTKFRLGINLRTAKALGLTVPPTMLTRADEVIE